MKIALRLFGYAKPYSWMVAGSLAASLLASICLVGLVSLSQPFFNEILLMAPGDGAPAVETPSQKVDALKILNRYLDMERIQGWFGERGDVAITGIALLIIGLTSLKGIFTYMTTYGVKKVGLLLVTDLRADLHEKIQYQSLGFFSRYQSGELMSRVTNDVGRIQSALSKDLADFVRVGFIMIAQVVWVFYIYWQLAFFSIVLLPLIVYPLYQVGKRLRKASRVSQERLADVSNLLQGSVAGARVVRAFSGERFEKSQFRQALDRLLRIDIRGARVNALSAPMLEMVGALTAGTMVVFAGIQIRAGNLNPGEFMSFLVGMGWFYASMKRLAKANNQFQAALAAGIRCFQILDEEPEVKERPGARTLPPFAREIEFRNVSFRYGSRPILQDINLRVPAGAVVALAGSSGVGKTTLVNLLLRFYDSTAGAILFDGIDVREVTLSSLRRQIGLVTQEVNLFTDTVKNNIAYGNPAADMAGVVKAARAAYAHEFIEILPQGYDTRVGHGGHGLSVGQQQRISIARAIWKDSPILILDEATSALDPESERLLDGALSNLIQGRTVFIIAHRPATVKKADKIFVVVGGKIVEEGSHETLLREGAHYPRLYDLEFQADTRVIGS